jgi:AraC-like DNA-binding protein
MNADQNILYISEHYKIVDFRCKCIDSVTSGVEFQEHFAFSYIRKGNYIYNVFRNSLDVFNGYFLVDKPGFEHRVRHLHNIPDECTIFRFDDYFFQMLKNEYGDKKAGFFRNNDIHSILVKANYNTEYLHYTILQNIKNNSPRLLIDNLVTELLHHVVNSIIYQDQSIKVSETLKRNHLPTLVRAKEYIVDNFENDISLNEIAENCYVSPFHFSRIFKSFTSYSPYQYLLNMRLKNAEMLIRTSKLSITEICFASGFNNLEHFSAAFKKKYSHSSHSFRLKKSKIS